jgi:hypothetical protein
MKMPSVLQNLLTNKLVLNIVCVLSALNIIGYLAMGKITAALFFIVLAILITQFNKNMIIVLGVPLILVNLFVAKEYSFVEGMEGNSDKSSDSSDSKAMKPEHKDALKKAIANKKDNGTVVMTPLDATDTTEPFGINKDDKTKKGKKHSIDYASTVEEAYDNLNSILGGDGIKNLTADTQNLMKQQMELAESMKGMGGVIEGLGPMMDKAKQMMEGLSDSKGGMGGDIAAMMQKMNLSGKKE